MLVNTISMLCYHYDRVYVSLSINRNSTSHTLCRHTHEAKLVLVKHGFMPKRSGQNVTTNPAQDDSSVECVCKRKQVNNTFRLLETFSEPLATGRNLHAAATCRKTRKNVICFSRKICGSPSCNISYNAEADQRFFATPPAERNVTFGRQRSPEEG